MRKIKYFIKGIIPENSFFYKYLNLLALKATSKNRLKPRTVLKFGIHFTDHCNLNCKSCDNFSPLANECFLDIDVLERDCARLSGLTKRQIEEIQIYGGEPLLHPQFTDLLDVIGKYFDTGNIRIITNGILLLKQQDRFWQSCKKNNAKICITKYPINLDFDAIKQLASTHNVELEYYTNTEVQIKTMYCFPLDTTGKQDYKDSFSLCFKANECITLNNGKIYTCPTIPCVQYFNSYFNQNLQVSPDDYIDIYKVNTINEIFDFLCKPKPFCRYCNIRSIVYGLEWGISKKYISEWTGNQK
jgi:MoaA/NifB/PqqE/SkfB family radical SAM enzyme